MVKKYNLWWFGNISVASVLAKAILQGTVEGKGGRDRKVSEDRTMWEGIFLTFSGGQTDVVSELFKMISHLTKCLSGFQ